VRVDSTAEYLNKQSLFITRVKLEPSGLQNLLQHALDHPRKKPSQLIPSANDCLTIE
jgi:hypothetical protein